MNTDNKYIEFKAQARYSVLGEAGKHTREIVYVLHGHGQQARYFIRKFKPIHHHDRLIVAPEGLSRYYLEGFTGKVGATWMTRDDRETDIQNYICYLNTLHDSILTQVPADVDISVIGFSQGAATATRWLMDGKVAAKRLLLWAGILPYDMDISQAKERLGEMQKSYIYGSRDPFVNQEKKDEMRHLIEKSGLTFAVETFEGAHEINTDLLVQLFSGPGNDG